MLNTRLQAPGTTPVAAGRLSAGGLLAYGSLRAPLALLELPLFVLLPAFYGREAGLPLALVGLVLFAARALDAIADPLLGAWIGRTRERVGYRRWVLGALPFLALGFAALLKPPHEASTALLAGWLAAGSLATYLAWSTATIAHQAWGAELGADSAARVRVTGFREACGLGGVLVSALLLEPARADSLIAVFLAALAVSAWLMGRAPRPPSRVTPRHEPRSMLALMREPWAIVASDRRFIRLFAAFMANGIASALPATLVLFFVADVLGAAAHAPLFLLVYFLAAALGMPVWVAIGARLGARLAWLLGMLAAIAAFGWAFLLGPGDLVAFGLICAITGLALGADLAMPSALLASVIAATGGQGEREGACFGVWALATKINLAAAAGLGLPLLSWLGYQPGAAGAQTLALSFTYALVPCAFKLVAAWLLWRSTDLEPRSPGIPT